MKSVSRIRWVFGIWAAVVILAGGILTSFHQPFRLPEAEALSLTLAKKVPMKGSSAPRWRMMHLLSGGCGCSQLVMRHLLLRPPLAGVSEQIVLIDGEEPYLADTPAVLLSLRNNGFELSHVSDRDIPANSGFHGVPLLMVTSPDGKVAYLGGYGPAGDRGEDILRKLRTGYSVASLPVIGCALGARTRRVADPFHFKY